jgi:hypothetical protein
MTETQEMQIQFSLLHLGVLVFLAALHLFVARIAASSHLFVCLALAMAYLLLLGATVQRVFRMKWIQAAALLYPLSLLWAPIFGATYSVFWNQQRGPWHLDALGMHIPSHVAWDCFEITVLIVGPATSIIYGASAWIIDRQLDSSPNDDPSPDKPDEQNPRDSDGS